MALTGKGFGISQVTAYRYLDEAIGVLAAQAPELADALEHAAEHGWWHVIRDGTIVASDRLTEPTTSTKGTTIDAWYSGETREFGGTIHAVMRSEGLPVWVSDVEPGSTHDLPLRLHPRARLAVLGRLPPPPAHPRRPRLRWRRHRRAHPDQTPR